MEAKKKSPKIILLPMNGMERSPGEGRELAIFYRAIHGEIQPVKSTMPPPGLPRRFFVPFREVVHRPDRLHGPLPR